jgi:ABC-type transport system involved in multi-copper enzyme maturation permease subunit
VIVHIGGVKALKLSRLNVWPVAQRELREGARRPVNHRLRVLSAGVGAGLLLLIAANLNMPAAQMGRWLFACLHTWLLALIVLIVPALTADSIARERREGTLGLLFLTPMSAGGIVAGKAVAQALRALTLWLAALPILAIPFMTGGLTWFDALSAMSLEFCAAGLCLAAGLLASALARERSSAFLLAFLLGVIFLLFFGKLFLLILFVAWRGFAALAEEDWQSLWQLNLENLSVFFGFNNGQGGGWRSFAALFAVGGRLGRI